MAEAAADQRSTEPDEKRTRARAVLFWLGVLYVFLLTYSMTPYTHQLDDIKEVVIYVGGPILLVTYLAFLALGWVEPPRRGTLITVGGYYLAVLVSAVLSKDFLEWKAWQGFWKQWVMLGPFVAFLGCCSDQKQLRRSIVMFTLVAFGTTVFGLLHFGVARPTAENPMARRGVLHGVAEHYRNYFQGNLPEMRMRQNQLRHALDAAKNPQSREQIGKQLAQAESYIRMGEAQRRQREQNSPVGQYIYGLAVTFSQGHAEKTMMSVILSRSFYGGYLLLMIPLAMGSFFLVRSWGWRWVPIVCVITAWICIKYTNSKIGIPGAAMQIVFLLGGILIAARLNLKNRRKWIALVVTGLIVVICLAVVVELGGDMMELRAPGGVDKALRRFAVPFRSRKIIWEGAWDIWKEHPIFGAGPMNFDILFPFYRRPDYNLNEISHRTIFAHNLFLDLLGETGLVGFVTFVSILGFFTWRLLVRMRRDPEGRHSVLAVCFLGAMLGFFTNNLFSPNARWPICAGNMWAVLGVIAGFLNRPMEKEAGVPVVATWNPVRWQKRLIWALTGAAAICGVWTSYYGVQYFRSAKANNEGLMLLGSDGGSGPVQELYGEIRRKSQQLRQSGVSPEERAEIQRVLPYLQSQFRKYREEALADFERAVKMNPHFTSAYYKIANLLFMGPDANPRPEDFRKALAMYDKLRSFQPEYAQIRQNLGSVYWSIGEYKVALKHMRRSSEQSIQPDPNVRYISSLRMAWQKGVEKTFGAGDLWRPKEFIEALQKQDGPVAKRVWENLSEATRAVVTNIGDDEWDVDGNPPQSVLDRLAADINHFLHRPDAFPKEIVEKAKLPESTRQWMEAHSDDVFRCNWIVLGDAFRGEVAMEYQEEAIRRARRVFEWWQTTLETKRQIAIGMAQQRQARKQVVEFYVDTARFTQRDGDLVRGLKVLRRLEPDNERVIREMVNAYIRMGRRDALEEVLLSVLERTPMRVAERSYLAQLYVQMGRLRDALRQTIILERIQPGISDAAYLRFAIAKGSKEPAEARKWAQAYLKSGRNKAWRGMAQKYLRETK